MSDITHMSNPIEVIRVVDRTGRKRWALQWGEVWWRRGVWFNEWTNRDEADKFRFRWRAQQTARSIWKQRQRRLWVEVSDE